MSRVLTLALRPRTLDDLIGQSALVQRVRGFARKKRLPNVWLLDGGTGTGKTTIARILGVSFLCRHQKVFGNPCKDCYHNRKRFDFYEINASDVTQVAELKQAVLGWDYEPHPGSRKRVYILDECHMMSQHSQNWLLKPLEDTPKSTVWILATSEPRKLRGTVQRRGKILTMAPLKLDDVRKLVREAMHKAHSKITSSPLIDALNEAEVVSPGLIVRAVDDYIAMDGHNPEDIVRSTVIAEIDTYRVCRAVVKGDWIATAKLLKQAKPAEAIAIQSSVAGYMKSILLDETEFGKRAKAVKTSIQELVRLNAYDDGMRLAGVTAVLFDLCSYYKNYSR